MRPPKHPQLYSFDESFIHPEVRASSLSAVAEEVAPQIYLLPLLSEKFCRKLVEECEHRGQWVTEWEVDEGRQDHTDIDSHRNFMSLRGFDGLQNVYETIVHTHLFPFMKTVWKESAPSRIVAPYLLKYEVDGMASMVVHNDDMPFAMNVYLNADYEGGGTHFPDWNYETGKQPVGFATLYPAGPTHLHGGRLVTAGVRYVLICDFY